MLYCCFSSAVSLPYLTVYERNEIGIHCALKVFALPSPIQPSEKPPSGHHLYLSLDPKFDGEHDFEGLTLCGDGLGRRIYESSRAWIRCLRLVTDLRPVLSHP